MWALTEKSLAALEFVRGYEGDITLDGIATELGVEAKSINGTLVALQRKKLIERIEAGTEIVNGKAKVIKYIKATPEGMAYDHEAALAKDEEEAAAKAAEKAAAKAAKEAASAE